MFENFNACQIFAWRNVHFYPYLMGKFVKEAIFCIFFGGLVCVGHSFAYVAHFVVLRDVGMRTQRTTVASRPATILATHNLFQGSLNKSKGNSMKRFCHQSRDQNDNYPAPCVIAMEDGGKWGGCFGWVYNSA
jgi:hypothetical protein